MRVTRYTYKGKRYDNSDDLPDEARDALNDRKIFQSDLKVKILGQDIVNQNLFGDRNMDGVPDVFEEESREAQRRIQKRINEVGRQMITFILVVLFLISLIYVLQYYAKAF